MPHPIGRDLQPSDHDDGTYHGAFQDFYFGVRYALVKSPGISVAPFVEVIIPSHRYETVAQSAVGRDLRMLLVGSAVGGFLDGILPGLYYQTRISYGIAQDALDIRTESNRHRQRGRLLRQSPLCRPVRPDLPLRPRRDLLHLRTRV